MLDVSWRRRKCYSVIMELTRTGVTVPDLTKISHNMETKANPPDSKRYHRKKATYGYLKQHFKITKFILQSGKLELEREGFFHR